MCLSCHSVTCIILSRLYFMLCNQIQAATNTEDVVFLDFQYSLRSFRRLWSSFWLNTECLMVHGGELVYSFTLAD